MVTGGDFALLFMFILQSTVIVSSYYARQTY